MGYQTLCYAFYADDLILMAENENDLKVQMQALGSYIEKWNMEINPKKSKVMIFNDPKKKRDRSFQHNKSIQYSHY